MESFFSFFSFTAKERKGFIVLMLFLILFLLFTVLHNLYKKDKEHEEVSLLWLSHKDKISEQLLNIKDKPNAKIENYQEALSELFYFDPNGLSVKDWKRLGFTDGQIRVVKNYEAKGGYFYKPDDLAKIYVISKKDYERVAPYIRLDPSVKNETTPSLETKSISSIPFETLSSSFDINLADTAQLRTLRGIGPVYAQRIVNFRDALGGFHSVEQIGDVYGISEDLFFKIKENFYVGEGKLRLLKINQVAVEDLAKHPYISRKQASAIVAYRLQHGLFQSIKDFNKIYLLDSVFLRKIEPYFSYD
ncbi:helix-hairpin-helix domain-containing protein [Sphingobacterium sp. UT-1RO-CII-1]|uniref:helix-hairpin-helix domain-containing protein n=1 Tax=Sphingobacterium sp. UT-1RO-CII-1 TaxID=2995225 RepID=UPI00227CF366|nr:helix-hairpin-helix domain-containing protein [Sphingobacterium sp. UT-1RO-CII-1]MCY4779695.1 helix-hairpin-helix domain-containing protein [Sphingobacterium sp. UT-1RO-CII-1]